MNTQQVHIFERLPVSDKLDQTSRLRVLRRGAGVAIALSLSAASQTALALGLGELTATSRLGEPLRAELSLIEAPSERVEAACFKIAPRPTGAEDLPRVPRARFVVDRRTHPARLRVSTTTPVNEPIIVVGVAVGCGIELARDYPLLLTPPETPPAVAQEHPAPAPPPRHSARRTSSRAVAQSEWQVIEGETLKSISQALFPHSKRTQQRWINATAKANPELFRGDARPADTPLPAGTRLNVADWRRMPMASTTDLPEARERAAPSRREPAPRKVHKTKPTASGADRLSIGELSEADSNLRPPVDEGTSRGGSLSDAQIDLLRQEHQLLARLQEQVVMQLALAEKIRKAEETVAALKASLNDVDQGTGGTTAPVLQPPAAPPLAAPSAAVPPTNVTAKPTSGTSKESKDIVPTWLLYLLLTAAVLALLLFLRRRRQLREIEAGLEPTLEEERFPAREVDIPLAADIALPPQRQPARAEDDLLSQQRHFEEAHNIDVAEHESAVELAEIMLSFGRVQGAAQTLADYIEANPKQAVRPWLKLLEVYRDAGMQTEFDTLAHRLNQTFNIETMHWDATPTQRFQSSLEGYPHVVAKLVEIWGSRECLDYLSNLVQDNRNGTRAGFPLPVLHEIMLLSSLLEHHKTAHERRSAAAA